jgi:GcrA cell cycle regulator
MKYAWTPERVERLTELWLEGHTAAAVAELMDAPSRNAVIGKINRLGIKREESSRPARRTDGTNKRWPADAVKQFRDLHAAGKLDDEIALAMGRTVSAIRRKRDTLGLKSNYAQRRKKKRAPRRAPITNRKVALRRANAQGAGVSLLDLERNQCRWAINTPARGEDYRFCGRKTQAGVSYCADHANIAYRPAEEK